MKNLSQISDNKDIITKEYLVAGYEPLLPATPLEPATKYLNGLKQWSSITIGSGGYAANLYGTNFTSTIVPAYYQMGYTADPTETVAQITRNAPGETMGGVYLFEQPIGVSTIDEGAWKFSWTGKIDSTAGNTRLRFEIFVRTSGGTETALFSVTTDYLKDVDFTYNTLESVQPIYTVNTTDRLGVKTYLSTTNAASITGSLIIGGSRSAYMNTPLNLRHTQLRGLNDDTNNVHVTSTERTNLTAVTALSTNGFIKRTGSGTYAIDTSTYSLSTHNHNGTYQPADADLTAIAGLTGTTGLLRKTAANTWVLDTNPAGMGDMTIAVYGGSASGIVAKSDALKETRAGAAEKVWVGTKAQYNAIVIKDAGTCYIS